MGGTTNLKDLPAGDYTVTKLCMEPTSFKVKEESQFKGAAAEFVDTKLMTRLTYTLDDISGKLKIGGDDEGLAKENTKNVAALKGSIVLAAAKVDPATGEIAGVFQSIQPSDTDLGAKVPKDVKITGIWYARLEKA